MEIVRPAKVTVGEDPSAMMFARVRELFEDYYRALAAKGMSPRGQHLIGEVRARLRDLQFHYQCILVYEAAYLRLAGIDPSIDARASLATKQLHIEVTPPRPVDATTALQGFTSDDQLRVTLELYYWEAARVRDILRESKDDVPGLSGFEAVGVRNVRNHLVEHPTRHHGVPVYSFAVGGPIGPQLKPIRFAGDPPGSLDEGLLANTVEFVRSLETALSRAIERLSDCGRAPVDVTPLPDVS